jgi:hypothetical protein
MFLFIREECSMSKQAPTIDWHIAESEAEWERLQATLRPVQPPVSHRRLLQHYGLAAGILLLVLVGVGEWLWQTTWTGTHPPVTRMEAIALPSISEVAPGRDAAIGSPRRDRSAPNWSLSFAVEEGTPRAAHLTHEPIDQVRIEQRAVNQAGDQVAVNLVMRTKLRTQAYRQTRFYRRIDAGWLQIEPDATLWGSEHSLETPYFIFHFRQQDAPTIIAVAPQLNELYTTLWRNFGLPILPTPEKLDIEVSVTQRPSLALFQRFTEHHLVVPSPAIYLAPVDLTDAELLAQSIALPLLEVIARAASEQNGIGPSWQPVLQGMRLWQLWQMDLPLAGWREEIVHWSYLDLPNTDAQPRIVLPEQYEAICTAHTLWMTSPMEIGIPLFCSELDSKEWLVGARARHDPLIHLNQIGLPGAGSSLYSEGTPLLGQTVALATLIEYTVEKYGRDRLPALVAGMGHYHHWNTLIPAVYRVSANEFEVGWQTYLAARYGVSLVTVTH